MMYLLSMRPKSLSANAETHRALYLALVGLEVHRENLNSRTDPLPWWPWMKSGTLILK